WVHWVVWNIPPSATELPENGLPAGSVEGRNSWKRNAYGGPCPPSGSHRYFFKLYALDKSLGLPTSADKGEVERAMRGHILAEAELMGTYKRR
ncbi:MAG TPA: YbhB/YbcL family Raf kinase inhibitor-like protein, partial [Geobacteraceae bacterium]